MEGQGNSGMRDFFYRGIFYIYEQGKKEIQEMVLFDIIKRFGYN